MNNTIRNKTIFAFKWVSLMQLTNVLGQLIIRLILASILLPDEIGLIAIITVLTEALIMAADMGFNASVIQRKNINKFHINTAFYVNIIFAVVLTLLVILGAGLFSTFFNDIRLKSLLQIVSVVIIIRASVSVQIGLCDRDLNFKKIVIATILGLAISSVLKVILAQKGYGAKSIVYGDILNHAIIAGYLWLSSNWLPSLRYISKKAFFDLFSFGRNIMLVNTLTHLSSKVDVIMIGKLLGAFAAGIFSISFMISGMLISIMNNIIKRVVFPSFSRIQEDEGKIQKGYLKAVKFISLIEVPICVGIFFVAPEFVRIFLKDEWLQAIIIIQILAIKDLFNSMGGVLWVQVLKAKAMSGLVLKLSIIRMVALIVFIYIGATWGLVGVAVSTVFYSFIFRFTYQHIVNRIINISMKQYLISLIPAFISAFLMTICLVLVKFATVNYELSDIYTLIIVTLTGIISYPISVYLIYKTEFIEAYSMIKRR